MPALMPSLEAVLGLGLVYATYRIALWIEQVFRTSVFYLPLLVAAFYLHQKL